MSRSCSILLVNAFEIRHQKSWYGVIFHIRAVSCMSYDRGL